MSDGIVALDPTAARALAAAMVVARDTWRRDADRLLEAASATGLLTDVHTACAALAAAADDCDLAATDLEVRARLIEAIDAGDGAAQATLSLHATRSITRWEAAVSGGVDETAVTMTATTGEDFLSRFAPSEPNVGGPGLACYTIGYRFRGELIGPDGRTYPLSTPAVDHSADGRRGPTNADWGPAPDGADVWALDGRDPGWTTVAQEQGVGQVAPEAGWFEYLLAGWAGGTYARSSGFSPASQAAHEHLVLDEYGVPVMVMGQPGGSIDLVEGIQEVGSFTPVMTIGPGGQARYETTPTTRGMASVGVAELVSLAADAGLTAEHAREQGNYAYTVAYQEHPDGRRRAIPVVYHLAFDEHGEPTAFMGYLAPDADGVVHAIPIAPRIHGGYQPAITVNPEH